MREDGAKETAERAVENCDAHARKNGCVTPPHRPKTGKVYDGKKCIIGRVC